jgi:hypothetical protein
MKTHSSLPTLLLLSLALASCGKKSATEQTNTFQIEENQKLSDFTINLQIDSNTPSGLATVLGLKKSYGTTEVEACTSFLIDKNTLITNSHCIPKSIKDFPNSDCGEVLQIVVKTDIDVVRTKCQKVISYSSLSNNVTKDNDFALVKIADDVALKRYFNLDRSGFSENDKITAWTLRHSLDSGIISSQFVENRCLIKSSDTFGAINSQSSSPIIGFKEKQSNDKCKIVQGNSGSPVITNNYSVAGIIHGGYYPKETNKLSSDDVTSNLGIITNFRCQSFKYEPLDRDLPSTCAQENNSNESQISKQIEPLINKKVQDFVNTTQENSSKVVKYNAKAVAAGNGQILITFFPKCVFPLEAWTDSDLSKIQKSFGKKSYQGETTSYMLTLSNNIDYYGNLSLTLNHSIVASYPFELLNLQKLNSDKAVKMSMMTSRGQMVESQVQLCVQ